MHKPSEGESFVGVMGVLLAVISFGSWHESFWASAFMIGIILWIDAYLP